MKRVILAVRIVPLFLFTLLYINVASGQTIEGFVWEDTNFNGIQDVGELGIPNVDVDLYEDVNLDGIFQPGELVLTVVTDFAGMYTFMATPLTNGATYGLQFFPVFASLVK